jgi:signal transduction histidine kinase
MSSALREYEDAYRFAKLGVDLAHKLNETSTLAGVYFLFAMFASHWIKPVDESIDLYQQAVLFGLQSGDHVHAGYSVARRFSHMQVRGMPLAELRQEGTAAVEMLHRISDAANCDFLEPRLGLIDWLRGERRYGSTLGTEARTETEQTAVIQARGNRSFEADWFMVLTIQRYYADDFRAAHEFAKIAAGLQPFCAGFVTRVEHAMFFALSMAALYTEATPEQRVEYDRTLETIRGDMRRWAELCPENHAHMQLLVEAECARIKGARIEAADLYDRAIAAARASSYTNIEALAAELAAGFWRRDGKPEFSRIYLDKALQGYEAWGATGKVADLVAKHGLGAVSSATVSVTSSSTTFGSSPERADSLDLATLLKASQTIAGEIVLEHLLGKLMDIIRENAGAESVVLVLESNGEFLVQGVKTAAGVARVLAGEPLRLSVECSTGIVNYVLRTSELVVLDDAAQQGKFRGDAYVSNRRPKSVLCAPVAHKGKLIGAVYLENNQVAGAFTPQRLEALNILLAQIAVSIENAMLYAQQERQRLDIEQLVRERTKELETAQGRLVELSRRAGMAEVASGVLHNVGNVMNSVNVGASVVRDSVRTLPVERLQRALELLDENAARLPDFLANDAAGRKLPQYLAKIGEVLGAEKSALLESLDQLSEHLEHMKKIIAAQQSYAKTRGMTEECSLAELADSALAINEAALREAAIEVVREFEPLPPVVADRHQLMQILVNLVSNAKHALTDCEDRVRRLHLIVAGDERDVRIEVLDNGSGITPDSMRRIFAHGFTTKRTGHGFGLHNCANAAQEMGGSLTAHSAGAGLGARFVLKLPRRHAARHASESGRAAARARR